MIGTLGSINSQRMAEKEPPRRCGQSCKRKTKTVASWKPKGKSFNESDQ